MKLSTIIVRSLPCPCPYDCHHACFGRSVGADGDALSDAELEWAVLCLEEAEERMAALDFSTAAGVLERVLGRQATLRLSLIHRIYTPILCPPLYPLWR